MSTQHVTTNTPAQHYVSLRVGEALVGIAVQHVRDLMHARPATPVPLAHPAIAGLLALRGQMITAIELRTLLDIPTTANATTSMLVVATPAGDQYALLADAAADVIAVPHGAEEELPTQMQRSWRNIAKAVYPLGEALLVILDLEKLLATLQAAHQPA